MQLSFIFSTNRKTISIFITGAKFVLSSVYKDIVIV